VIYMGIARLREVQVSLLQSLPAHTCAAVVQHAAAEGERKLLTCLGDLWHDVQAARLGSPAIVIVGDVLRGLACSQPGDDEGRPSRQAGAPRASRSAC